VIIRGKIAESARSHAFPNVLKIGRQWTKSVDKDFCVAIPDPEVVRVGSSPVGSGVFVFGAALRVTVPEVCPPGEAIEWVKREYSLGKETLRNAERSNAEPFREQTAQRSRIAAVVVHLQCPLSSAFVSPFYICDTSGVATDQICTGPRLRFTTLMTYTPLCVIGASRIATPDELFTVCTTVPEGLISTN